MKKLIIAASVATLFSASAVAAPAHKHGHSRPAPPTHNDGGSDHKFHRDLFNLALFIGAVFAIDAALDGAEDYESHNNHAHNDHYDKPNRGHRPYAYDEPARHQNRKFSINQRQERQRHRIRDGINNGSLVRDEAKRLRKQQRRIAQLEADFRADGRFSRDERATIQARLDKASKRIYQLKHNDRYTR